MTNKQKVLSIAKEKGIIVDDEAGGKYFTVELIAPDGFQFGEELHGLVCEGCMKDLKTGDLKSSPPLAWKFALEDVKNFNLKKCPDNCPCKES